MLANIEKHAPELLRRQISKGVTFKCSDAFVTKFLSLHLGWSERKATRAAQKLPENWQEQIRKAWLRLARLIRDERILPELIVNSDQSQVVIQQGTDRTWNECGARQVSVVGESEKRAFTCMPAISMDGKIVGLQSIWQGKTPKSQPSRDAPGYEEALQIGCTFESSMSSTYWSTHHTMHKFVENTLAPYFRSVITDKGLPDDQ
ncbi:hypothetical protein SCHPADRAFT_824907 [Schizopora paradoxa]|uniref:Uncharacterized protein n=1 Tax=Schizopora paradoxa TaxID=27342 RepID=A0A0H2S0N5_9AGAM|nr:hypothetical protein SCHPADRAFT_824907 [Schizopora paradoxa]